MDQAKWLNKTEVLKDLLEVCGQPCNVDGEVFTEIRDKPPISTACEDDEETYNYLMGFKRGEAVELEKFAKPDLDSITKLLNQVQEKEGRRNNNSLDERNIFQSRSNALELTKLNSVEPKLNSKLNPTVKEFVPKAAQPIVVQTESNAVCIDQSTNGTTNICEIEKIENELLKSDNEHKISERKDNLDDGVNKTCTESCIHEKHLDEVKALKDIINKIPNTDSFQDKTERNIALNKLMQLLANAPVPKQVPAPVKLLTPGHFASVAEEPKIEEKIRTISNVTEPVEPQIEEKTSTISQVTEEVELEDPNRIKESVKKVNDWFQQEEPVKKVKSTPHFAPPTYKRKEKSMLSVNRSSTPSPCPTTARKKFVPSKQAEELFKKFSKASEEKNLAKPNLSIWDNLEKLLKEKDEEIRRKRNETLPDNH